MSDIGLYIHVPFCLSKCPYCDFYSVGYSREKAAAYSEALIRNLRDSAFRYDTVYFGGGTPILLYEHIGKILEHADIAENAEITVEANPCMAEEKILGTLVKAGVNRISFGVQSMIGRELEFLGRRHTVKQAEKALVSARKAGLTDISADMMIGLPGQTADEVAYTANRLAELGADHISAYILKVEENTPFAKEDIILPDDESVSELYLGTVKTLAELGYEQYEISNFARRGHKCKHNLKYWRCEEYFGVGAAAHSFLDGKRFFVSPDIDAFVKSPVQSITYTDENAGGWEEFAMLKLRLSEGISFDEAGRFGKENELRENAKKIPRDLLNITESGISLTAKGFVLSNAVIGKLIFD